MSFADYIARDGNDFGFFGYVYISGIPEIFSNVDLPAAWTSTLGVDRTWERTFTLFRVPDFETTLEAVSQEVDFETGVMSSGNMTVEMQVDPEASGGWVDRLIPEPSLRVRHFLDPDFIVKPSDITFHVTTTAGLAIGQRKHLGLETVEIVSVDVFLKTFKAKRGLFGSPRQWYGARSSTGEVSGGLVEMTSWPDSWKGRIVEVWLQACTFNRAGKLAPLDSAPRIPEADGGFSKQIFRGIIYDQEWADDYSGIQMVTQSVIHFTSDRFFYKRHY